jgi:hypothetical protein
MPERQRASVEVPRPTEELQQRIGQEKLMSNFSLAGQRASQDALLKLRESLLQSADLRK